MVEKVLTCKDAPKDGSWFAGDAIIPLPLRHGYQGALRWTPYFLVRKALIAAYLYGKGEPFYDQNMDLSLCLWREPA